MHVLIINGSPRTRQYSNTDRILQKFTKGMCENGSTFEQFEVSDRAQWDAMRLAFARNKNILIALPLFVECVPGLLMEFLETLAPKQEGSAISFLLQGGFPEAGQLRCGEAYLKILAKKLGCEYHGTLIRGNNFSIRFCSGKQREKLTEPYAEMGREFAANGGFESEKCRQFAGPEVFPVYMRWMIGLLQKTIGRHWADRIAREFGCRVPLDLRPYPAQSDPPQQNTVHETASAQGIAD